MENIIILIVLIAMVGLAVRYIWKHKKKGVGCIGCPMAGSCAGRNCSASSNVRK